MEQDIDPFGLDPFWLRPVGADEAVRLMGQQRMAQAIAQIQKAFSAHPEAAAFRLVGLRPAPIKAEARGADGGSLPEASPAFEAPFHSMERQRDVRLRGRAVSAGWIERGDGASLSRALGFPELASLAEVQSLSGEVPDPAPAAPKRPRSI